MIERNVIYHRNTVEFMMEQGDNGISETVWVLFAVI